LMRAGRSSLLPVFPKATQTLRENPRRLILLIGEPRNSSRNPASSDAENRAVAWSAQIRVLQNALP
jgi:hypothetical protein